MPDRLLPSRLRIDRRQRQRHLNQLRLIPRHGESPYQPLPAESRPSPRPAADAEPRIHSTRFSSPRRPLCASCSPVAARTHPAAPLPSHSVSPTSARSRMISLVSDFGTPVRAEQEYEGGSRRYTSVSCPTRSREHARTVSHGRERLTRKCGFDARRRSRATPPWATERNAMPEPLLADCGSSRGPAGPARLARDRVWGHSTIPTPTPRMRSYHTEAAALAKHARGTRQARIQARIHDNVMCAGGCGTRYSERRHGHNFIGGGGVDEGWLCPTNTSCLREPTGDHHCGMRTVEHCLSTTEQSTDSGVVAADTQETETDRLSPAADTDELVAVEYRPRRTPDHETQEACGQRATVPLPLRPLTGPTRTPPPHHSWSPAVSPHVHGKTPDRSLRSMNPTEDPQSRATPGSGKLGDTASQPNPGCSSNGHTEDAQRELSP